MASLIKRFTVALGDRRETCTICRDHADHPTSAHTDPAAALEQINREIRAAREANTRAAGWAAVLRRLLAPRAGG